MIPKALTEWAAMVPDGTLRLAWHLAHQASDPASLAAREAILVEALGRGLELLPPRFPLSPGIDTV